MSRLPASLARALAVLLLGAASGSAQEPIAFLPEDFGKIVVTPRQSLGGIEFEQAIGSYQNEPVSDYGENSAPRRIGRAVGRLDLLYNNGKTGFCTAFVLDDKHLMTNHHCVPGIDTGGVKAAQFVAGYVEQGREAGAERFTVDPSVVASDVGLDFAVLRVFGRPADRFGTLELVKDAPEDGELYWIIGHPMGQAQHISREGCAASLPAVSDAGKLVHTCDTLGGNSGSPVIRVSDRRVVGLHHAGDSRSGVNFAIPMSQIMARSPVVAAFAPEDSAAPGDTCTALWNEARELGCDGYAVFLDQCADHLFTPLAQGLMTRACTAQPVIDTPDTAREGAPPDGTVPEGPGGTGAPDGAAPGAADKAVDPALIRLAADGSGDLPDLAQAVAAAAPGGRIELGAGLYTLGAEELVVDKPLTLTGPGEGAVAEIRGAAPVLIRWTAKGGSLEKLRLVQSGGKRVAVVLAGGSLRVSQSDLTSEEDSAIVVTDGGALELRDNRFNDGHTGVFVTDEGSSAVIRNNIFLRNARAAVGVSNAARAQITGNLINAAAHTGIEVSRRAEAEIADNRIRQSGVAAIALRIGARAAIQRNTIRAGTTGILVTAEARAEMLRNLVTGQSGAALWVEDDGHVEATANSLTDNDGAGIFVTAAGGVFTGNDLRGNRAGPFLVLGGAGDVVRRDNTVQ
ncbi:right-handed parallel beta-helix repeat-containing protein [Pseudoponticoccus marisrubri]|uniref:Serine protease n=1 Tax=Pseudoponticoccus marisrubri TaxID=1685382 RepID=A0A0W7WM99_9RHOB|nr:right-handed parallel beta-helix repeat-containing protein [Pseudoponticoccus marisrubri]KUF11717.1 hypothetical protein AVJ23_03790 [Pseudoponticoccus marisrubri]